MPKKPLILCLILTAAAVLEPAACREADAQRLRRASNPQVPFSTPAVSPMIVIGYPSVQKELALTSDQTERIQHLWGDYRKQFRDELIKIRDSDQPRLQGQQRIEQIHAIEAKVEVEFRPKIAGVLDGNQQTRLAQIAIQCASFHALQDADVVKSLGLTKDQQSKIAEIVDEEAPRDSGPVMRELRRQHLEKAVAVLTKDQQQKFDKLRGKPIDIQ